MTVALEPSQHRTRLLRVTRLPQNLPFVDDRGVGGEHNTIGSCHSPRLLHGNPFDIHTGGLILASGLIDIRGVDIEIETERVQQLATTRRA